MWKARDWRRRAAQGVCLQLLPALLFLSTGGKEATVEELKARVQDAKIAARPSLCIQISEQQLDAADRLYMAGDIEKGQEALTDVVAFSELARDYSVQLHKHEKQSEIAIRKMTRKLTDLKRTLTLPDQKPVQDAIDRLQKIRDDLLFAMFPKGSQK